MQATDVNWFLTITELMGGLALFIWGMQIMADGLQKSAGDRMRFVLEKLTKTPVLGAIVGAIVTGLVQSSSATTVMLVGFVNASLMTLGQAVGIIFGANIGTTVTAQLVVFKVEWIIMPCIFLGVALRLFATKKSWKNFGEIILGFGVLFLGMKFLSESVMFLRHDAGVKNFLAYISHNLYLGIIAGTVFTGIIQSSSATSGLVIALLGAGLITVPGGFAIMLGANIGTCVTALLASTNTNYSARRVAVAHIMFNVIGVIIFIPIVQSGLAQKVMQFLTPTETRQLANFHTLFNGAMTILMLPVTKYFVKLIEWMVSGKDEPVEIGIKFISDRLLATPSLALEQATQELVRMMGIAKSMVVKSKDILITKNKKLLRNIRDLEDTVDKLQIAITGFLTRLTQKSLSEDQAERSVVLLHAVHDAERIGDHAMNLAELADGLMEANVKFSEPAEKALIDLFNTVDESCQLVSKALQDYDVNLALKMYELEDKIDFMAYEIRESHVSRLKTNECKPENGIYFLDMASNLERIGDHCLNIAQVVIGDHEKRIEHDEEKS